MKKIAGDNHHFTYVYQKPQSHEAQFLRYRVKQFFCHFGPVFALYPLPLTTQRNKILKKNEKRIWRCHHFKLENTIKWCMLTQIWSVTDIIFCHFMPIFALLPHYRPWKLKFEKNIENIWRYYPFTHVHNKSRSYDVRFLRYKVQRTKFFVILGHFLPFDPPDNPKNQDFEKIRKTARDIIILHLCTTNDNHMMYGSWDMWQTSVTDIIFCHFGSFFAPLPP